MLDAPTRQRHLQLWASRTAADKQVQRQVTLAAAAAADGETGSKKKKKELAATRGPISFKHELAMDPHGFAFGGVDPGTLHAHGKLVKVHSVHYSIGLAGVYKLHVGLRHQEMALPGSPFTLTVDPGNAYAGSTALPPDQLPLHGIADEQPHTSLLFWTADVLGNPCRKGGANPIMRENAAMRGRSGSTTVSISSTLDNAGAHEKPSGGTSRMSSRVSQAGGAGGSSRVPEGGHPRLTHSARTRHCMAHTVPALATAWLTALTRHCTACPLLTGETCPAYDERCRWARYSP